MPSYSMAGMFLKGDTRNPATRPMDGAQYIHVIEDNSGNKAGSWVDAQGRNAVEREANHKQMFQMENAGKSKYQDDKDFLVSYTQSNKKCDTLRAEATVNDVEITKDKGEIAGYVKTIQGSEYQMQSVLSDCGEPRWKKEQVALLKLEEVKFTDTKMMGAYLKFYGEAILFDQAVNSRRAKQTELDGKIANKNDSLTARADFLTKRSASSACATAWSASCFAVLAVAMSESSLALCGITVMGEWVKRCVAGSGVLLGHSRR